MRRKIAQKMAQSKHTAAHFTFVEECDVTELKALRARLKAPAEAAGVKLSFLPFIVKAVRRGAEEAPVLNTRARRVDERDRLPQVLQHRHRDGHRGGPHRPRGQGRRPQEHPRHRARTSTASPATRRNGKAKLEDLTGSTFTITSLGAQGGLFATPIINFPEVAILGVHQMKQKPVVKDGQIVIGDVMLLSLSFDHRIVDGHVGAAFAYEIIGYLEQPDRLFLEMA